MNLVCCLPFALFYNSSDLIMNHLIYKIGSIKMKQSNTVKKAIVSMLNAYQTIKHVHYSLNVENKYTVIKDLITCAMGEIKGTLNEIMIRDDVPFNIIVDLIAYENWLINLNKTYHDYVDLNDINFRCRYELPQSGYDCVYLDFKTDKVYITLYD